MHYPARKIRPGALLREDLDRFPICLTAVNYDRQAPPSSNTDLPPEHLSLHLTRAVIIVKVEPDLTPCDDIFRFRELQKVGFRFVVIELGIVRVHPNARIDIVVMLGNSYRPPKVIRMRVARTDIQHRHNTGLPSPSDHLVTVNLKRLAVNMTMGIKEH